MITWGEMRTWTPLWNSVVESSLWDEPDLVCKVYLTMLAIKDADHVVRMDAYGIARKARKTEEEVLEALKVLAGPDTKKITKQPFEGRRIKAVDGGWLILNGEKYRAMVQDEMRRARNRRAQANYRARKKGKPLPGEQACLRAQEQGVDVSSDDFLPERGDQVPAGGI